MNLPELPSGGSGALSQATALSANAPANPALAEGPALPPVAIKLKHLSRLLHVPARWQILRELARGEPLPVHELARRAKCPAPAVSKHMALLKKAGVVQVGFGRLYKLTPACQPTPDGRWLDLGHCLLKLEAGR